MSSATLESTLREARVLVCAGTGGVGKTTIAAALAIRAALSGRRTLVLTIDPARRLADALGLEELGSRPRPVDLKAVADARDADPNASLDAMMLDAKPTFDRLVTRLTSSDEERQRILDNRIYEHLSSALAGSAEYAAMEQVHELVQSRRYDLIVVDTPPADHALDFLRAPRRLREFLESRFVQILVRPAMSVSRIGMRLFARSLQRMLGLLERIAGAGFLDDLTEFLRAIDGLSSGFRERATRVEEVLLGSETGFVLISSPNASSLSSTLDFIEKLEEFRVPLKAIIVNRLRPWPIDANPESLRAGCENGALRRDQERLAAAFSALEPIPGDELDASFRVSDVSDAIFDYAHLCAEERKVVAKLESVAARRRLRVHAVPEQSGEIEQFEQLVAIGSTLDNASGNAAGKASEGPIDDASGGKTR